MHEQQQEEQAHRQRRMGDEYDDDDNDAGDDDAGNNCGGDDSVRTAKKKFRKRKHGAQHAQHSRAGNGTSDVPWLLGRTIWRRGKIANSACSWLARLPCTNNGQCNRALA